MSNQTPDQNDKANAPDEKKADEKKAAAKAAQTLQVVELEPFDQHLVNVADGTGRITHSRVARSIAENLVATRNASL